MKNNYCLITGANSGIGLAAAKQLAQQGYHIILICRNATKGRQAQQIILQDNPNAQADLIIADLSNQQDIQYLYQQVNSQYPHINILINNAAVVSTTKKFSTDNIELTLATNHLGPFLLTTLLLPKLHQAPAARIINISSNIHRWNTLDFDDLQFERRPYKTLRAYAQSKTLLNMLTFKLARNLANTNVTVNALHPGAVRTNLGSQDANNIFLKILDKFIKVFFITPEQAARSITYLATAPELANVSGMYFCKGRLKTASTISKNPQLIEQMWQRSGKLVGLE